MKNEIRLGSILSYMQMALSIVIGLIYTPVMIKLLGQSEYGLYNTVSSTISMLSLLSLGFNSGYIRYYARYKVKKDQEAIWRLNGLFLLIFSIISIIALMAGLYLSGHLSIIFDAGLTGREYEIARVLMILSTISLAISFINSVFNSIISAHEKFIFQKIISMLTTVVSPLITLPLLLLGYRSIALVLISLILTSVGTIINAYYIFSKLQQKFYLKKVEGKLFVELFSYTVFIAVNMLIDQINWNIDKLLLGRFRGTAEVAIYSVGFSIYSYYQSFSVSVSGVFTPRIHQIINLTDKGSKEQKNRLTEIFVKVGRIQYLVLGLVATGFALFGYFFITRIWAGKEYNISYYVAVMLMIPATIPLIQNLGIEIQRAENQHQFRSIIYSLMAIINLGLSIILCQMYGALGSAIGTAISLVVANGIIMNIYYQKKCNIDIIVFWKNIIKMSVGFIIPVVFGVILNIVIPTNGIVVFLIKIIMYCAIYLSSMWLIAMNEYEKDLIKSILGKIVKIIR